MIAYRLCKSIWQNDLSGRGAEITGGRWNSKGKPMVYTSSSRALCMAEIAVHTPLGCIPDDYSMVEIKCPDNSVIREVKENELPQNWQLFEHSNITQCIGNHFISVNKELILKVPSAVVQGDYNYLINPLHPDSKYIIIVRCEPFRFDKRLFK